MKKIFSAEEIFELYKKHRIICTDTRRIVPGAVFFALKGENFDANAFAEEALAKGCACAVIDNPKYNGPGRFLVKDTLSTLQQIAVMYRKTLMIPVIGITGTNGKTTTKELVRSVLNTRFRTYATEGNLNNHIGVPLSLLAIPAGTEIAVIEMGASHPGEIAELCKIALPVYGIITNIGKAHLEGFGSFANIVRTKTALYDFLRKVNGKAFVNADDPVLVSASADMDRYCYGKNPNVFLQMTYLDTEQPDLSACLHGPASAPNLLEIKTHLIGVYNLANVAAAACIGRFFGLNDREIQTGISNYVPGNLRSQSIRIGSNLLIADAYNANPTSMAAAIDNFAGLRQTAPKTVILGDMLELGKVAKEEHQKTVDMLRKHKIPQAFLVGNCFSKTEHPKEYQCFPDTDRLIEHLQKHPLQNRCILLKGSHGIHLERVIEIMK